MTSDLGKAGLVFGTDTGNTEEIGERICDALAAEGMAIEMFNVTEADAERLSEFSFLIFGIPTWDFGGIQEDWEAFESELSDANLSHTTVALYGLGDQFGYADYFVDAMGWLHQRVLKTGARVVGAWPTEGYDYTASLAESSDKSLFCGLAIDEDQQFELTDDRIQVWVQKILAEARAQHVA